MNANPTRTAFVFAGGGSLGAVQVGMLHALAEQKVRPDFVVGASAGAINAAYFAADPTPEGVSALDRLWCGLTRRQIMPMRMLDLLRIATRRAYIVDPSALRRLLERHVADVQMRLDELLRAIPVIPGNIAHSDKQHAAIVEAILGGQTDVARTQMEEHVDGTAALLRGFLS